MFPRLRAQVSLDNLSVLSVRVNPQFPTIKNMENYAQTKTLYGYFLPIFIAASNWLFTLGKPTHET